MKNHFMNALLGTAFAGLSMSTCLAATPTDSPKPAPAPAMKAQAASRAANPAVEKAGDSSTSLRESPVEAAAAPAMEKPAASPGEPKPLRVARKRSRETDRDARACLNQPANIDIIRCAEKYL